jgi:CBS domain-containing protein
VQHNIGSLVVLNTAGTMVGIITERDVLRATHKHACDLAKLKVSDLMTTKLIVAGPEDTVNYVRGIMTENRIRHLPIVDGDKMLGLITFHDVAKASYKEITFENELLKKYIKHWPE